MAAIIVSPFDYLSNDSPGLVLSTEPSNLEILGPNPSTIYRMDFYTLICCQTYIYVYL